MSADIQVFRCLQDNIGVLIRDPVTGACAAIDAPEEAPILAALERTGWQLSDILVTHRHSDHIGGIVALKARFGCRVVGPARAGDDIPAVDVQVREGDTVTVGQMSAQVWETPGHCRDHIAFWFENERALFTGDTLFTLGCGRVMESSYETMWHSLQRLANVPDETRIYSGHDYTASNARFALAVEPGNEAVKRRAAEAESAAAAGRLLIPSTMGMEKATNPFLRAGEPSVARAVSQEGQPAGAVFQAVREWKNKF